MAKSTVRLATGWSSPLAKFCMGVLLFEIITGLAITLLVFHAVVQWGLILHTVVGIAALAPLVWYLWLHWRDYRRLALTHVALLGYLGLASLAICLISGVVVTWQGLFDIRMSELWRNIHLFSTLAVLVTLVPHMVIAAARVLRGSEAGMVRRYLAVSLAIAVIGALPIGILAQIYSSTEYNNEFPDDYSYLYGKDRPFAPSLARTSTGGAFDSRSLAGSESCGTAGCHSQILEEWGPSAHRYSAMDKAFQAIQNVMAKQNGPESTRYCGGCHDPISLFSGTKNIFAENLTNLSGYQEGISCLVCHSIRETDLEGNANYLMSQPAEYLWQWSDEGLGRVARDFLIRTYPDEHNRLSKRLFKAPEYCAACHKQFIDQEVNKVGWVQLQNQYDNWANSHWNHEGDPEKTVECRECHMPLVDSTDPSSGDDADYNRHAGDAKHRSHRFIASNQLMPRLLKMKGWEKQVELTEKWLQGKFEIPEIRDKWAEGPIVKLALDVPETVVAGETLPVRVIFTSNKVGHDYPTGPLDIIQSWLELTVTDDQGNLIFATGRRDEKNFIEPGSFLFKAEPVDQYGNLIDRHNLWEMVGVRFRRAIFPGYSDTVEYKVDCPASLLASPQNQAADPGDDKSVRQFDVPSLASVGTYHIEATLYYRKIDQFLINFLFGEDSGITAQAVDVTRASATVSVKPKQKVSGLSLQTTPLAKR